MNPDVERAEASARGLRVAFRPADVVLVFAGTLGTAILALGRPEGWHASALAFLCVAAAPFFLEWLRERWPNAVTGAAADFFPGVAFVLMYTHLGPLVTLLHPGLADARLQEIDRMLFGVQPAVWLAPYMSPWLNDFLMACYSSYYVWATLVGAVFLLRGERTAFDRWALAVTIYAVLNFTLYAMVPAEGPRFMLAGAFPGPIRGKLWAGALADAFGHSPYLRDCFPSGHTALTVMVLAESWRRIRRLFWAALPICTGLIVATVACRFHYGIDLVAAVPFAFLNLWLADRAMRHGAMKLVLDRLAGAAG